MTPARVDDIPTPALVVDVPALDRNIAAMARFFADGTCRLRPHVKAHKTPAIAQRQLAAGSCVGLTCATVGEAEAVAVLRRYGWPGNVRELRNLVERLMIMVPGDRVSSRDLSFLEHGYEHEAPPVSRAVALAPLHHARDEFEKQYILRALANQHGNMSRTAEVLGVERSNLYKKMRAFGIMPTRRGDDEDVA